MNKDATIKKSEILVSVVIIYSRLEATSSEALKDLHGHLDASFHDYEIILIARPSDLSDQKQVEIVLGEIPSVRLIELLASRHEEAAIAAGLENAIGDYVVLFNPMIDPPEVIKALVEEGQSGYDVIMGIGKRSETLGYKLVRPLIHWLLEGVEYRVPRNSTGLRCLSRRAVNAITLTGRSHHQLHLRIARIGFPSSNFQYQIKNAKVNKKTLREGFSKAVHVLVFNSTKPLRWMSAMGVAGSMLAFLFAAYSLIMKFFRGNVIEGWTSLVLFTSVLFMILFMILAFFGEYLGRLLDEGNEQQDYAVMNERTSSVVVKETRYNYLKD